MTKITPTFLRNAVAIEGKGNQKSGWSLQQGTYHDHPETGFYKGFTENEHEAMAWVKSGILPGNNIG